MGQDRGAKTGVALMAGSFLIVFSCMGLSNTQSQVANGFAARSEMGASRTPFPAPTGTPTAATATNILLAEDFNNPDFGQLPRLSYQQSHYALGYAEGEYSIQKIDARFDGLPSAVLPGSYRDAALIVDARVVGATARRYVMIACRAEKQRDGKLRHYRLSIHPEAGQFLVARWDGDEETMITGWVSSPSIRRGNQSNRLELSCTGSTISASVNGIPLASLQDPMSAIHGGQMWLGLYTPLPETVEVRFDNLVVLRR